MSPLRTLIVTVAISLASSVTSLAAADSIVLKNNVRLDADATAAMLRDVAYLDGDEAMRLADTEVGRLDANGTLEISLDTIRAKLTAAGGKLALVDVSGRSVTVRGASSARPVAMKPLSVDENARPRVAPADPTVHLERHIEFFAEDATGTTTPRGLLAQMLTDVHAAKKTRLRLVINGADDSMLDAVGPHRFEIVPLASLSADRVAIRIIERDGDTVVARHDITVVPTLETTVATAVKAVRRGQSLDGSTKLETAWVAPSAFTKFAGTDALRNATAADHVALGERLDDTKVRKPVAIKKSEKVTVRREVGLVAIELVAVADEDGAMGDVIRLRAVDRKDRKDARTFTARVTGPGRATMSEGA